ncbi:MAG: hypothetical protein ACJA1T_001083 [Zhongshania aliphaticivorans]|jgi:hypothetical protein|uniref:hypothetical protein n=1 Tax=Zhongshania aliphaticivorans TaxID=1470434 RepID=UPI0039C9E8A1|tara:strand:- start:32353 stop:32649 length:297 start_codon:yes stop_codon:yes gene_type:complete
MDLTHGSVLLGDRELLADVPMYINAGGNFVRWGGCLHLNKQISELLNGSDYSIRLRDGRLGDIRIRKVVNTNGALHVEILFEGVGELAQKSSDRQQSG